jgi:lipoate-protein ligase B
MISDVSKKIDVHCLGSLPYAEGLQLQKKYHAEIINGKRGCTLLCLEHPPVITLGKNANLEDVLISESELLQEGIALEHIDRGGKATAHEPGQLVVYPLMDLRAHRFGAKAFVDRLEACVLDVLKHYNIEGRRDEDFPGVWVGLQKFCSVGIRIQQGVSYHGMALNISNTLETFKKIIPCGIQDRGMVTLSQLLDREISIPEVTKLFIKTFCKNFEMTESIKVSSQKHVSY